MARQLTSIFHKIYYFLSLILKTTGDLGSYALK